MSRAIQAFERSIQLGSQNATAYVSYYDLLFKQYLEVVDTTGSQVASEDFYANFSEASNGKLKLQVHMPTINKMTALIERALAINPNDEDVVERLRMFHAQIAALQNFSVTPGDASILSPTQARLILESLEAVAKKYSVKLTD